MWQLQNNAERTISIASLMTKATEELFLATSACAMESDTIAGVNGGKATRLIPRDFDFVSNLVSLYAVGLGILPQLEIIENAKRKEEPASSSFGRTPGYSG
jgi:hypothetical protein